MQGPVAIFLFFFEPQFRSLSFETGPDPTPGKALLTQQFPKSINPSLGSSYFPQGVGYDFYHFEFRGAQPRISWKRVPSPALPDQWAERKADPLFHSHPSKLVLHAIGQSIKQDGAISPRAKGDNVVVHPEQSKEYSKDFYGKFHSVATTQNNEGHYSPNRIRMHLGGLGSDKGQEINAARIQRKTQPGLERSRQNWNKESGHPAQVWKKEQTVYSWVNLVMRIQNIYIGRGKDCQAKEKVGS